MEGTLASCPEDAYHGGWRQGASHGWMAMGKAWFVWKAKQVRAAGGRVALCGLTDVLLDKVVEVLKLSRLFDIYQAEEEAMEALREVDRW